MYGIYTVKIQNSFQWLKRVQNLSLLPYINKEEGSFVSAFVEKCVVQVETVPSFQKTVSGLLLICFHLTLQWDTDFPAPIHRNWIAGTISMCRRPERQEGSVTLYDVHCLFSGKSGVPPFSPRPLRSRRPGLRRSVFFRVDRCVTRFVYIKRHTWHRPFRKPSYKTSLNF